MSQASGVAFDNVILLIYVDINYFFIVLCMYVFVKLCLFAACAYGGGLHGDKPSILKQ
jgi:hypothetical protein